ncbi:MAG: hypothetical protein M3003_09520 [Candidatus Dormibacteraeota bacterium]|nr:hypothetical protein [Candidatus Dormibacteraeota bacterium]
MAAKDYKRVRALMDELAEAKVKQAEAFSHARGGQVNGRPATIEDARYAARERMAFAQNPGRRSRDVEVIRIDLAVALDEVGMPYPPQDG